MTMSPSYDLDSLCILPQGWDDIHRLVQLATRIWVKKYGNASKVVEDAVRRVANVREAGAEELSELCLLVGSSLQVDGKIQEAVVWLERSRVSRGVKVARATLAGYGRRTCWR
jgi:uncharacterized protein YaeQ